MADALLLAALLLAAAEPSSGPAVASPATASPIVAAPTSAAPAVPDPRPPTPPSAPAATASSAGTAGPKASGPARAEDAEKAGARPENLPRRAAEGGERAEKSEKEPSPAPRPLPSGNLPPSLTARALLDELRRAARDRRTDQVSLGDQRQKLEALQKEIESSRAALREETQRLQALVAASARADRKDAGKKSQASALDALARTVRGMKPAAAAELLGRVDRGLAAAILGRMRPADAALVLDRMEPATGASLVALLAGRDRS